jgi:predicted HTH domain antitoxin
MPLLSIQYPDDLFAASGKSRETLERELSLDLAVRLFEKGSVSLGKAAQLAGLSKIDFMAELSRSNITVINLDSEEIEAEVRASRGDYSRR